MAKKSQLAKAGKVRAPSRKRVSASVGEEYSGDAQSTPVVNSSEGVAGGASDSVLTTPTPAGGPMDNMDPRSSPGCVQGIDLSKYFFCLLPKSYFKENLENLHLGPGSPWLHLASGVDSLELTFSKPLPVPPLVDFASIRATERWVEKRIEWIAEGRRWALDVQAGGSKGSRKVICLSRDFALVIPRNRRDSPRIEFRAAWLWAWGLEKAIQLVLSAIAGLWTHDRNVGALSHDEKLELQWMKKALADFNNWKVHRADLAVDFHGFMDRSMTDFWRVKASPEELADGKPRGSRVFGARSFTGWWIAMGGDIGARIYLKSRQIELVDAPFMLDVWKSSGRYCPHLPVWRVEFEIKREGLTSLVSQNARVNRVPSLLSRLPNIWRYCTDKWLTLRKNHAHDRAKSLDERWVALSAKGWMPSAPSVDPAIRLKARDKGDLKRTVAQIGGQVGRALELACREGLIKRSRLDEAEVEEDAFILLLEGIREAVRQGTIDADSFDPITRAREKADKLSLVIDRSVDEAGFDVIQPKDLEEHEAIAAALASENSAAETKGQ